MQIKDIAAWNKYKEANLDRYGARIMSYAEAWADLMEREMASGKTLEEVARRTSQEADPDITRFPYYAAVVTLTHDWVHGEALRRWHNLDTQLGNEGDRANESGGVVNPSLLNITRNG